MHAPPGSLRRLDYFDFVLLDLPALLPLPADWLLPLPPLLLAVVAPAVPALLPAEDDFEPLDSCTLLLPPFLPP
jgi:hypothetical protein